MYLNFFQLNKKPFSLAPDPEFLYLSQQHKDALGAIVYGIREREGFVSVVGEVGTGKTTIVRSYLHKAGRNQTLPIFIFNSRITFPELIKTFLCEIGIDVDAMNRKYSVNEMVRLAYQAMIEKTRRGENLVLIIDEAQNMPVETLGNLCILSNFETSKAKLIQIVLVGQPELQKKLDRYELRQLRQRIAYRALITPLSMKDSVRYLHHRLSLSSRKQGTVFTTSAIKRIVKHSQGIPRVINILCENSLVAAYGLQKKPVSLKIVKQVIAEYEGKGCRGHFLFKRIAGSVLIVLLTALFVASYLPSRANSPVEAMVEQVSLKAPQKPDFQPVMNNETVVSSSRKVVEPIKDKDPDPGQKIQEIPQADGPESTDLSARTLQPQTSSSSPLDQLRESLEMDGEGRKLEVETKPEEEKKSLLATPETISPQPAVQSLPYKKGAYLKVAKRGDTVSGLFLETYGFYNTQALEWIKSHNPHIANMDEIQIDQIIYFPGVEP